ncbi:spermine/spermidine synthase family protein [Patellaria atrata CBS 101060]|uniref:Spermine/spermidine synthase family protein n=1 Tax=Patellaria atrata CBS 101060 TaxID=1346257 RepID=A0A9P4SK04_9PEZI|nr:spermine/spermidine synthase family protein [Patellaria atrata CBS 101060]
MARKTAPRKPPQANAAANNTIIKDASTKALIRAACLLLLAAVSSPVSQQSLSPVYGSIPSSLFHQRGMTMTALLAFMGRSAMNKFLPTNLDQYIPVLAYWIPTIQYLLFQVSGRLGPTNGPVITEAVTYFPLLFFALYTVGELLEPFQPEGVSSNLGEILPVIGSYVSFSFIEKTTSFWLPRIIGTNIFLHRSGLQLLIASASAALSPSKLCFLAIPAMLHTIRANPHYTSDATLAVLESRLQPYNYTLLERQESITGYISVLDGHDMQFRLLRCDHSLLGGEWLITPERAQDGQVMRETIYSVFTMLESARLVETGNTKPDSKKKALTIGLGIGTAPKAFISHGINTTIVEIDPVVHYFATKYFDLPSNHTAAIQNAIPFVDNAAKETPGAYDYIIHDVFTGGAEPTSLFTLEFLEGLKALLKDDGVVAINYAGDMHLPPTILILSTIRTVFPTCRIFRDQPPSTPPPSADPKTKPQADFINMVVFCTKSTEPLTFRYPTENDFRGSMSRREFLYPKPDLEVQFPPTVEGKEAKVLKRGGEGEVEKYHQASAVSHWHIMRTVLPDGVWENW